MAQLKKKALCLHISEWQAQFYCIGINTTRGGGVDEFQFIRLGKGNLVIRGQENIFFFFNVLFTLNLFIRRSNNILQYVSSGLLE